MKITKYYCSVTVLFILCLCSLEAQEPNPNTGDTDLDRIMEIWPGTYNNDKQIEEAKAQGEAVWQFDDTGKGGWLQVQSHYIKLDMPELGKHVLYVEEYRNHEPDSTYRQRVYTLSRDDGNNIRVKMWPFKDKKKFVGAWKDSELLSSITKEDISAYPDKCDLLVTKENEAYNMNMNGKDCAFGDKVFNYQVLLDASSFSYRDKITTLSTGELISTAAEYQYHKLDKIK